jgi:hypothetical protein
MLKATTALLLVYLIVPGTVHSQGFKSSIKQCSREVYDLMEGEFQYTCISKSEVTHPDAKKDYIEECKTTFARRYEKWSGRFVDRMVNEECKSKATKPEIIIEYPEDWP